MAAKPSITTNVSGRRRAANKPKPKPNPANRSDVKSIEARRQAAEARNPAEPKPNPSNRSDVKSIEARRQAANARKQAELRARIARMEDALAAGAGRNAGRIRRDLAEARKSDLPFVDRVEARADESARPPAPAPAPAPAQAPAPAPAPASPAIPPRRVETKGPSSMADMLGGAEYTPVADEGTPAIFSEKIEAPNAPKAEPDPAEMQKLFKTVMGSSFDPNSRMDKRKMQEMQDFYTTSGGMAGRSPTRFALDYYKTL